MNTVKILTLSLILGLIFLNCNQTNAAKKRIIEQTENFQQIDTLKDNLYERNDINFSFELGDEIASTSKARILLKTPKKEILNLFTDTISKYEFSKRHYFKSKGKYTLSIYFESKTYGADSLNYDFKLNGMELNVSISISFDYRERLIKQKDIYVEGNKVLNGYIRLNKYYDTPETIEIQFDADECGNEFYHGPFFTIKNNSLDTLYGEHLPGYFWGTLSFMRNDSILRTFIGILDYNFVDSPPLYPDSTKVATVGSFGIPRKLIPFEYRFEVMLSKEYQGMGNGIGIYKEQPNFDWWAGTKEYYKLKYDFKIDKNNKND